MKKSFVPLVAISWMVISLAEPGLEAAPNFKALLPFAKRVECDPGQTYDVADTNGPWMVLATSFSGDGAEQQARELVQELRKEFNLEAYQHRRTFDFTEPVVGLGINEYGQPRKMRYRQSVKFDEIAVLVGNFESAEDPALQRVLEKIKNARPDCLDLAKRKESSQRFAGLRAIQRHLSPDPEKRMRGPMGSAFVTRNPLLPDEYFAPKGPSPWVVEINRDVEFSLLECPGKFSVRVATFRGESTMDLTQMDGERVSKGPSKLEIAADKAHRLTTALREKGVEAYEFHDEFESIVTIGSFESVGTPRADGRTEINPAIHAIIESYKATSTPLPTGVMGLMPRTLAGISFDAQPWPVQVPRFEEPNRIVARGDLQ